MNFDLRIGDSSIISGDLIAVILVIASAIILIIIIITITWRKLLENEKLKYEFITIIAHKFRTPLTSVKWLLENVHQAPEYKETFDDIKDSNDKLINLTNTLIELTNLEKDTDKSYEFSEVHLNDFVRQITDSYKNAFHEKNLFVSINTDPADILISADKNRLEYAFRVVLENAQNYSQPGKDIEINTGIAGKYAFISVTDHGIGISADEMKHVSSKFYRSDSARQMDTEGFGVGLYLAESIIKRHKGSLEAYSPGPGLGSVFSIFIPRIK